MCRISREESRFCSKDQLLACLKAQSSSAAKGYWTPIIVGFGQLGGPRSPAPISVMSRALTMYYSRSIQGRYYPSDLLKNSDTCSSVGGSNRFEDMAVKELTVIGPGDVVKKAGRSTGLRD